MSALNYGYAASKVVSSVPSAYVMGAVRLEFCKMRRKHLWLISLGLLGFQGLWLSVGSAKYLQTSSSYMVLFSMMPVLNGVVFPLLCALIASTLGDIEHQAHMWKELLCLQDLRSLIGAKWIAQMLIMLVVVSVQTMGIVVGGWATIPGHDPTSFGLVAQYWLSTLVPSLMLSALLQALCLVVPNQFVALSTSVSLCFLGLFIPYLPTGWSWCVPSAYFSLMSPVAQNFDTTTSVMHFSLSPFPVGPCIVAFLVSGAVLYATLHHLAHLK